MAILHRLWQAFLMWLELIDPQVGPTIHPLKDLETTLLDWQLAQRFFEEATDPDLIDYAIYWLKCAESRYNYLLKQAKQQGLSAHPAFMKLD